jgi:hypothetical protein
VGMYVVPVVGGVVFIWATSAAEARRKAKEA